MPVTYGSLALLDRQRYSAAAAALGCATHVAPHHPPWLQLELPMPELASAAAAAWPPADGPAAEYVHHSPGDGYSAFVEQGGTAGAMTAKSRYVREPLLCPLSPAASGNCTAAQCLLPRPTIAVH